MQTLFRLLPLGARFEFRGRRYEKLALSFAGDEDRCGNVFQDEAEVFWDQTVPAIPSSPPWQPPARLPGRFRSRRSTRTPPADHRGDYK